MRAPSRDGATLIYHINVFGGVFFRRSHGHDAPRKWRKRLPAVWSAAYKSNPHHSLHATGRHRVSLTLDARSDCFRHNLVICEIIRIWCLAMSLAFRFLKVLDTRHSAKIKNECDVRFSEGYFSHASAIYYIMTRSNVSKNSLARSMRLLECSVDLSLMSQAGFTFDGK